MSRSRSPTRVPQHATESRSVKMEARASLSEADLAPIAGVHDANSQTSTAQDSEARASLDRALDIFQRLDQALDILQRQEYALRTGSRPQSFLLMANHITQGLIQLARDGRSPIMEGEAVPFPRAPSPLADSEDD